MKTETIKKVLWLSLFAIAMGFMETAVVVYLRALYYPAGFTFPLVIISNSIAITEFWREFATIIMLIGIGFIYGKTKFSRFAYFIVAFAIWDIFYYLFLYVFLRWPQTLFTWDILFLIPVPWVGPVLAPCIVALQMIVFGWFIIYYEDKHQTITINSSQWLLLISGVVIIIISFTSDYIEQVSYTTDSVWSIFSEKQLFEELKTYVPKQFCWWLFWLGDGFCGLGVLSFMMKYKRLNK